MVNNFNDELQSLFPDLKLDIVFKHSLFPVIAEGTVDGLNFLFRAKHDDWSCELTKPEDKHRSFPVVSLRGYEGDWAGYMPIERVTGAIKIILNTYQTIKKFAEAAKDVQLYKDKDHGHGK